MARRWTGDRGLTGRRLWRAAWAAVGTAAYYAVYRPDWLNPALVLYDVPVLVLAFSFFAELLIEAYARRWSAFAPRAVAFLAAVAAAWGAGYRSWPISGHLTLAASIGTIVCCDRRNARWLRLIAIVPALLLVAVRAACPQTALMGSGRNTISAVALGTIVGAVAAAITLRRR